MKILPDNCVDVRAVKFFSGHDVAHARDRGWQQLSNGMLLSTAASAGFDASVTVDKNLRHQQNLQALPLTVIELDLVRNRLLELAQAAAHFPSALADAVRFRFVSVRAEGVAERLAERTPC